MATQDPFSYQGPSRDWLLADIAGSTSIRLWRVMCFMGVEYFSTLGYLSQVSLFWQLACFRPSPSIFSCS
jgi:hypothetical protein